MTFLFRTTATLCLLLTLAGCERAAVPSARAQDAAPASTAPRSIAIARGKVEVEGGLLELGAPAAGVVESVGVAEGDTVHKGQMLLRLADEPARQDVAVAEAELRAAETRHHAQAARLPAARQFAARLEEAAAAGGTDRQRADDAAQAAREIESSAAVAAADAQVAAGKLAQARALLARTMLSAPVDGSVVRLSVQAGMRIDPQSARPLLVLLPRRPLVVRAELNESFAAAVRPGMRVEITPDSTSGAAGPSQPGRVLRIAPVMSASRLEDDGSTPRASQRVVDCFVVFDKAPATGANGTAVWRPGQNVRVNFHE